MFKIGSFAALVFLAAPLAAQAPEASDAKQDEDTQLVCRKVANSDSLIPKKVCTRVKKPKRDNKEAENGNPSPAARPG